MKSETIDLRSPYCTMVYNRSSDSQILVRQQIIRYAQRHGNKPAAKHFGCDVRTVREWKKRFNSGGTGALKNKSRAPHRCPHKTSIEVEEQIVSKREAAPCYGPKRLKYFNPSFKVSQGAIYRILKERGLLRKHRKKYQRKQDLRDVKAKYKSLTHHQEDVKHLYDIPEYWSQMTALKLPKYEYTIRDTKSGFTIVGFANEYNEQYSTMLTETYLRHLASFGIDLTEVTIQTDNGSEFGARKKDIKIPGFVNTIMIECEAKHQYIPPGCSNANADVESFHSTVEREFFELELFRSKEEFFRKAQVYQSFYNFTRPNFSKKGKTPLQIFLEDQPGVSPEVLNFPVYDLDALFRQKMELPAIKGRDQYVHKLPEIFHKGFEVWKKYEHLFCKNNLFFDYYEEDRDLSYRKILVLNKNLLLPLFEQHICKIQILKKKYAQAFKTLAKVYGNSKSFLENTITLLIKGDQFNSLFEKS